MRELLYGATAMGTFVVGLFFLRFYARRSDALFAYFGIAFLLMSVNHVALGLSDAAAETTVGWYVLRLLAFGLIIVGIIQKNRVPD
ncbi:MAG: hypothetical protein GEU74_07845 [Nitriliruptorales bacterium]|nr:hypothetical protein [Nitriliruptorales bacterium]